MANCYLKVNVMNITVLSDRHGNDEFVKQMCLKLVRRGDVAYACSNARSHRKGIALTLSFTPL